MQGKVSSKHTATTPVYVGIDVCKEWLDIHFHPLARDLRVSNDKVGLRQLKRVLSKLALAGIVLEATGKFHRAVHRSLHADGFGVTVVDPYQARMFAKSIRYLAKTDRLDARLLALMGQALALEPHPPADVVIEEIQELVHARSAAEADLTAKKNQLDVAELSVLRKEITALVKALEQFIVRLDAEIALRIRRDPALSRRHAILISIPGIGPVTAAALLADMEELGRCNGKQAAMLAGLAPLANDSGAHAGKRSIRAGRAAPRRALYMAALSASRFNRPLARFAEQLKSRGKPAKVVLVAVMRKLIVLANTLITQNRLWTPQAA